MDACEQPAGATARAHKPSRTELVSIVRTDPFTEIEYTGLSGGGVTMYGMNPFPWGGFRPPGTDVLGSILRELRKMIEMNMVPSSLNFANPDDGTVIRNRCLGKRPAGGPLSHITTADPTVPKCNK